MTLKLAALIGMSTVVNFMLAVMVMTNIRGRSLAIRSVESPKF